ncbi:MAG TPA: glycosyltransferase family 1 protein, partial [Ktedonobacterales bacterium]|nr:glycosyltransferase family 1 protein [Ktedonobacterales bacterium]
MRIAFFTETFLPRVDGIVTRLTHTIEELQRAGDKVLVVAPGNVGLPAEYAGARVTPLPAMPFPLYPDWRLAAPLLPARGRSELAAFAPDVIHTLSPFAVGVGAITYARRHAKPLVASYHANIALYTRHYHMGLFEGVMWRYLRLLHSYADLTLCTSRPVQTMLQTHGFPPAELWLPGVDTTLFHPSRRSAAWRARLSDDQPDAPLLLYVGRLASEKSLERLLPALHALPACRLALVGNGPDTGKLRRMFTGWPVTFVGALAGEELAAAYASADIFVLPSSSETLGLAAIEAMASGVPVVGARRGGLLDTVRDGETGLLFDPDAPESPDGLIPTLRRLIEHPNERQRMG